MEAGPEPSQNIIFPCNDFRHFTPFFFISASMPSRYYQIRRSRYSVDIHGSRMIFRIVSMIVSMVGLLIHLPLYFHSGKFSSAGQNMPLLHDTLPFPDLWRVGLSDMLLNAS